MGKVIKRQHRLNKEINVPEVRVVGDNVVNNIYSTYRALQMAEDLGVDLVEISPNAVPPVCKLVDYKKFLYDMNKNKQKSIKVVTKEIQLSPFIGENDYQRKIEQAREFLKKDYKVKLVALITGGQRNFDVRKDKCLELALGLVQAIEDVGLAEAMPSVQGIRLTCIIKPKKK